MIFLCFILATGISQEKVSINVNNVMWYEKESPITSKGKESYTTVHFHDKAVRVIENMDEIRAKIHRCKAEEK